MCLAITGLLNVAEPLLDLGVLLAGGKGRRMGGVDKGALMLGDQRLADIAINKLRPLSRQLAVSANAAPDWMPEDALLIEDRLDSEGASVGPAGGIIAALARDAWIFVPPPRFQLLMSWMPGAVCLT